MTKPSSALVLCTVGLTSGGSSGILSRSAKTLLGTVNRSFCASARPPGNRNSTASVNEMVRLTCLIESHSVGIRVINLRPQQDPLRSWITGCHGFTAPNDLCFGKRLCAGLRQRPAVGRGDLAHGAASGEERPKSLCGSTAGRRLHPLRSLRRRGCKNSGYSQGAVRRQRHKAVRSVQPEK